MAMTARREQRVLLSLIVLAFVLSTVPIFIGIYREAVFQTSPRDDYSPTLLALIGRLSSPPVDLPSLFDNAPYGYRVLSVAIALPFYYLLPVITFSNLPTVDEPYMRATAALAMVSYLSMLLTVVTVYAIARRRMARSEMASALTGLLGFGLLGFVAATGTDPLPILIVSLLVYFMDRPALYAPIVIVSAALNEKVLIIFAVLFAARVGAWLITRRERFRYGPQVLATAAAVGVYVAMLRVIRLPAQPNHTDPTRWFHGAVETLTASLSMKGAIQNGIPLLILAILLVVAAVAWSRHRPIPGFALSDVVVAPTLMAIGIIINAQLTVGRLAMFSFPLYLPLVAYVIDDLASRHRVWQRPDARQDL